MNELSKLKDDQFLKLMNYGGQQSNLEKIIGRMIS